MKILVTGGCGFIGSHLVARFIKEGYNICIIDNLSNNKSHQLNYKHKFFKLDISDTKCEYVFKSEKFDMVVHLAGNNDIDNISAISNTKSNILGLVNILELSVKYNVKKFIYFSSGSVYGNLNKESFSEKNSTNPESFDNVNKYLGEYLVQKWYELYNLSFYCLRLSNVYGYKGYGVINKFINNIITQKDLITYGDGSNTRDYIYIDDVIEATIYLLKNNLHGIYNVSSDSEYSTNDIISILKEIYSVNSVLKGSNNENEIKRSRLDNNKLKDDTGWCPLYSLSKGIQKTYKKYTTHSIKDTSINYTTNISKIKNKLINLSSKIYNLAVFSLYIIFGTLFGFSENSLIGIGIFYICIFGLLYGVKSSILASFLGSIGYILILTYEGFNFLTLLINSQTLLTIFLFITIGYISGYSKNKNYKIINEKNDQIKILEDKYSVLNEVFIDTLNIKEKYQEQILSSENSFNKIFSIVMELENLKPEVILNSSISVVETVLKNEYVIIHNISKNSTFARIIAHSKNADIEGKRSIYINENFEFKFVLKSNETYVNLDLKENIPSLMGPVIDRNKIIAIISIYNVEFEKMNQNYINLFKMVLRLISSALSRAKSFEEMMQSKNYIKDTPILTHNRFQEILKSKIEAKERFSTPFILLKFKISSKHFQTMSHQIINYIRETDYIGQGTDNEILILLSNTQQNNSTLLIDRLKNNKIDVSILNEEESKKCLSLQ